MEDSQNATLYQAYTKLAVKNGTDDRLDSRCYIIKPKERIPGMITARIMASYYDLDTILTDSQKVPCTFELTIPKLGYLDGNAESEIKEGTKLELPLWLAEMLAVSQAQAGTNTLTLDLPSALSVRVINALKADPKTLDLRALAPHYYALGARMLELFEEDDLGEVLNDTFKKRAKEIADQAHNPRGALGEGAEFLRGLEEDERHLFRAAHDSTKATKNWIADLKKT